MLSKTSLSKPLFKEILQVCNTVIILQIIVKKLSKHLSNLRVPTNMLLKQFIVCCHCFFEDFEPQII